MWLVFVAAIVIILALAGAIVGGGIWTIAMFALAVIIGVPTLIWGLRGGFLSSRTRQERSAAPSPLPSSDHANTPPSPTTPDDLVDARQRQQ